MDTKFSAHPAMFRSHPMGFILSVVLIAAFGLGLIILMLWYLNTRATRLSVEGTSIIWESGLLSKEHIELSSTSIRSVKVSQSFANRIFGVGTIAIYTAGDRPEIQVAGIPQPQRFREIVKSL